MRQRPMAPVCDLYQPKRRRSVPYWSSAVPANGVLSEAGNRAPRVVLSGYGVRPHQRAANVPENEKVFPWKCVAGTVRRPCQRAVALASMRVRTSLPPGWRGQASHKWLVKQQRMGSRAESWGSSEFASHHGRLAGVYATASTTTRSDRRRAMRLRIAWRERARPDARATRSVVVRCGRVAAAKERACCWRDPGLRPAAGCVPLPL
jgi:hypothetical protein